MAEKKDTQRKKFWDSQEVLSKVGRPLPEVGDIKSYLYNIFMDDWFRAHFPRHVEYKVRDGRRRRYGGSWEYVPRMGVGKGIEVSIPRVHRKDYVVLRLLAYVLKPEEAPWHGPEFCGILLRLTENYMGEKAREELEASFSKHRVKFSMPRVVQVSGRWE